MSKTSGMLFLSLCFFLTPHEAASQFAATPDLVLECRRNGANVAECKVECGISWASPVNPTVPPNEPKPSVPGSGTDHLEVQKVEVFYLTKNNSIDARLWLLIDSKSSQTLVTYGTNVYCNWPMAKPGANQTAAVFHIVSFRRGQ